MLQIPQLIESERKKAGLTQAQMAKRLKMSRETYKYWEKKTPGVDKIRKVEQALNLPEGYFLKAATVDEAGHKNHAGENLTEAGSQLETRTLLSLAESNKELAQANRVLARNQEELIQLVKGSAGFDTGISSSLKTRFSNIYELIAQLGTGLRWNSLEEATEALNKYATVHD